MNSALTLVASCATLSVLASFHVLRRACCANECKAAVLQLHNGSALVRLLTKALTDWLPICVCSLFSRIPSWNSLHRKNIGLVPCFCQPVSPCHVIKVVCVLSVAKSGVETLYWKNMLLCMGIAVHHPHFPHLTLPLLYHTAATSCLPHLLAGGLKGIIS